MVADFSDIKRLVKGWIDQELDHKMILRHDDPLVGPLRELGEPMYLLESNPTVERIARLIFEKTHELGFHVVSVRVWETPSSFAAYSRSRQRVRIACVRRHFREVLALRRRCRHNDLARGLLFLEGQFVGEVEEKAGLGTSVDPCDRHRGAEDESADRRDSTRRARRARA